MHPETPSHSRRMRMGAAFSWLAVALVLLSASATGWAQGQMRKSLGPEPGRLAPVLNDDGSDSAQQDDEQQTADENTSQSPADANDNKTIQPNVVTAQQQRYATLRDIWRRRLLPDALKSDVGSFSLRDSGVRAIALQAKNVEFFMDKNVGYYVDNLRALLVPRKAGEPVNFDDPEQFDIHILAGELVVRPQDLDALFNNYLLDYQPRSLSRVTNKTSKDTLTVEVGARLFEFIPPVGGLPTTLEGPITVTDDNKLVYTPTQVKQFGMPVKGLLSSVGLDLSTLTPFDREGIRLEEDKLIMDPERIFPPPHVKIDHIDSATLSDQGLTLKFSSDTSAAGFSDPPVATDSYIWLQAGDARFYSTLLVNANLQLMNNADERLKFNLYHYRAQSAAGTISAQVDGALIVRVPNEFEIDDGDIHQYSGLTPRSSSSD
ncbi:hypothetical protein [Salinisphaera sp.]|uniref:hypothetical protein n=1 Tax=Salinisphaera sp. TaxID=1914330 RepID=UPI0025F48C40|nr:hypothetical protein [Salinisphaera sp.]